MAKQQGSKTPNVSPETLQEMKLLYARHGEDILRDKDLRFLWSDEFPHLVNLNGKQFLDLAKWAVSQPCPLPEYRVPRQVKEAA